MRRAAALAAVAAAVAMTACGRPDAALPAGDSAVGRPPPTPAANVADRDRAAWLAALAWPADCEQGFAAGPARGTGVELFPLGDGTRLAQVACAPGAYQGSHVFYRVDPAGAPTHAGPLAFPDFVASGIEGRDRLRAERTTEVVGLPTVLPDSGRLRVLRRFRGVGDCGLLLTYDVTTAAPTLVELRGKLACDGDASTEPERWEKLGTGDGRREAGAE